MDKKRYQNNNNVNTKSRSVRSLLFLLISLFFISIPATYAQQHTGLIQGRLLDSADNEPLPSANIYLSNTTHGATSGPDGSFEIKNIPAGNYTLVFRFIGYKPYNTPVKIREDDVLNVGIIKLEPDLIQMEGLSVKAKRSKKRERNLKIFETAFLGSSSNASRTEIINPEIIYFSKDPDTNNLVAEAADELHIVNEALGYEMFITLSFFSWNIQNDIGSYFFTARFEELESVNEEQRELWHEKRENTYFGSFRHFLKSLVEGEADDKFHYMNGYVEPDEDLAAIEEETDMVKKLLARLKRAENDELKFRIVRHRTNSPLKIRYKGTKRYESEIEPKNDEYIYVDRFGNLLNPENIIYSGFWSNYRMADLLPFDYRPKD